MKSEEMEKQTATSREPSEKDGVVAGRNAVMEAIKSNIGVEKIFVTRGDKEGSLVRILALAREKKIPVQQCDHVKLEFLCGTKNHQGVAAYLKQITYCTVDDILANAAAKGEPPLIIIGDEIADPHNLGAIIRSADACGAHGIIIPKHRGVGVTPAVSKASAGAVVHVPIAKVTNLTAAIEELKNKGVWVYGGDGAAEKTIYETDWRGAAAIVVGSEGFGMSRLVTEKCDFLVKIPMCGKVNSLNASVAAALIMFEARRGRSAN